LPDAAAGEVKSEGFYRKNRQDMAQKLIQSQSMQQVQTQRLTQQQMLVVRMLEMPLAEFEQNVMAELDDNPALESVSPDDMMTHGDDSRSADGEDGGTDFDTEKEREDRESALDEALAGIGMDDEMPEAVAAGGGHDNGADYEEIVYGDRMSFYDRLKEQMLDVELTGHRQFILEYLIGSLDSDGLLRKDLDTISDELAIYHGVETSAGEVEETLRVLQTFDPPGIGARDLRECLMLQIERRRPSDVRGLMMRIVSECFDDFMSKHRDRIAQRLGTDAETAGMACDELLRLNPKPGAALGETEGRNIQQITPDFIIDTGDDGSVSFTVSRGRVPELHVSPEFTEMVKAYRDNKGTMSRRDKEALLYAKEKMERAKGFIEAVRQRRHTLYVTMKAIIELQKKYFQDGDEADLKPMILKDVADRTGLDISTISRVSNMKYAQTRWGTFLLRHFFSDGIKTVDGEELSTRKIKVAMQEIIDGEDKTRPLSDDALKAKMAERGFPVARRTLAKYREQLGIPVARLRKK